MGMPLLLSSLSHYQYQMKYQFTNSLVSCLYNIYFERMIYPPVLCDCNRLAARFASFTHASGKLVPLLVLGIRVKGEVRVRSRFAAVNKGRAFEIHLIHFVVLSWFLTSAMPCQTLIPALYRLNWDPGLFFPGDVSLRVLRRRRFWFDVGQIFKNIYMYILAESG